MDSQTHGRLLTSSSIEKTTKGLDKNQSLFCSSRINRHGADELAQISKTHQNGLVFFGISTHNSSLIPKGY
jgi:hypothetical protein